MKSINIYKARAWRNCPEMLTVYGGRGRTIYGIYNFPDEAEEGGKFNGVFNYSHIKYGNVIQKDVLTIKQNGELVPALVGAEGMQVLQRTGTEMGEEILHSVLSTPEAAKVWGKSTTTVFGAAKGREKNGERLYVRFYPYEMYQSEYSSSVFVTVAGMLRVFGTPKNDTGEIGFKVVNNDRVSLLNNIYSLNDAAHYWGLNRETILRAINGNSQNYQKGLKTGKRFLDNEARKAGQGYLLTKAGMLRVFGEPEIKRASLSV